MILYSTCSEITCSAAILKLSSARTWCHVLGLLYVDEWILQNTHCTAALLLHRLRAWKHVGCCCYCYSAARAHDVTHCSVCHTKIHVSTATPLLNRTRAAPLRRCSKDFILFFFGVVCRIQSDVVILKRLYVFIFRTKATTVIKPEKNRFSHV